MSDFVASAVPSPVCHKKSISDRGSYSLRQIDDRPDDRLLHPYRTARRSNGTVVNGWYLEYIPDHETARRLCVYNTGEIGMTQVIDHCAHGDR